MTGYQPERPDVTGLAAGAAEAIRTLNHATFPGAGGLTGPADAYQLLASLAMLAGRLPQLLTQLHRYLDAEVDAGRVAIEGGEFAGDPPAAAIAAGCWLESAAGHAHRLTAALDAAQQVLAYAASASEPDDEPDDERGDRHGMGERGGDLGA